MKVVFRQGQLGESVAPLPKLLDLLLQFLKKSLSLVLSCSTVHLDHLGEARYGLRVNKTTQDKDTHGDKVGVLYLQDVSLAALHTRDEFGKGTDDSLSFFLGSSLEDERGSGRMADVSTWTGY